MVADPQAEGFAIGGVKRREDWGRLIHNHCYPSPTSPLSKSGLIADNRGSTSSKVWVRQDAIRRLIVGGGELIADWAPQQR